MKLLGGASFFHMVFILTWPCRIHASIQVTTVTDFFLWPPPTQLQNQVSENHVIQVSILLPATYHDEFLEPAQKRSGPGILAGFQTAQDRGLIDGLVFNLTFRDTKCNNIYGPKSFTDAIVDGVNVFFGPSCEYALGRPTYLHYIMLYDKKACINLYKQVFWL